MHSGMFGLLNPVDDNNGPVSHRLSVGYRADHVQADGRSEEKKTGLNDITGGENSCSDFEFQQ